LSSLYDHFSCKVWRHALLTYVNLWYVLKKYTFNIHSHFMLVWLSFICQYVNVNVLLKDTHVTVF
jgi:hypothetical protein